MKQVSKDEIMTNSDNPLEEESNFSRRRKHGPGRGQGRGRGHGRGRGRGRPPVSYPIEVSREISRAQGEILLTSFELQLLQLSDIEELTQQQIAEKLNISQTSVWRYLKTIRVKIAEAISQHSQIVIRISD